MLMVMFILVTGKTMPNLDKENISSNRETPSRELGLKVRNLEKEQSDSLMEVNLKAVG